MINLIYYLSLFSSVVNSQEPPSINQSDFESTASFRLVGDGYDKTYNFRPTDNLIFCQLYQNKDIWIRFAQEYTKNGENSPHIDIDICNYNGSGTYDPIDPQVRPCTKSGWDIWWHDKAKTYFNQANSNPCKLFLTQNGDTLSGNFWCESMILQNGDVSLDIKNGSFKILIERK